MMTEQITVLRGKKSVRLVPYVVALVALAAIAPFFFKDYMDHNTPSSVTNGVTYVTTPEQRGMEPDAQR